MTDDYVKFLEKYKDDSNYEIRIGYHYELMCPNPRESYLHSRTYEQLKAEYDLLHAGEITEEDLIKLSSLKSSSEFPIWLPIILIYSSILIFEFYLLFLMISDRIRHG